MTDAHLKEYANLDPGTTPNFASTTRFGQTTKKGWIRAVRYEAGFDENSSRLMSSGNSWMKRLFARSKGTLEASVWKLWRCRSARY